MPIIPVARDTQVENAPDSTPFTPQSQAGGRGAQALAQGAANIGAAFAQIARDEKDKGDTAFSGKVKAQIRSFETGALVGGKGIDIVPAAQLSEDAMAGKTLDLLEWFDGKTLPLVDGASNIDQRTKAESHRLEARGNLEYSLQQREVSEVGKYRQRISNDNLTQGLDTVTTRARFDLGSGESIHEDKIVRDLWSTLNGEGGYSEYLEKELHLSPEDVNRQVNLKRSEMMTALVGDLMNDYPSQAKEVFDDAVKAGVITREDAEPLRGPMQKFLDVERGQVLASKVATDNGFEYGKPLTGAMITAMRNDIQKLTGQDKVLAREELNRMIQDHNAASDVQRGESFKQAYNTAAGRGRPRADDLRWLNQAQEYAVTEAGKPAPIATNIEAFGQLWGKLSKAQQIALDPNVLRPWLSDEDMRYVIKRQAALNAEESSGVGPTVTFDRSFQNAVDQLPPELKKAVLSAKDKLAPGRYAKMHQAAAQAIDALQADGTKLTPQQRDAVISASVNETILIPDERWIGSGRKFTDVIRSTATPGELEIGVRKTFEQIPPAERLITRNQITAVGYAVGAKPSDLEIEDWYNAAMFGLSLSKDIPQEYVDTLGEMINRARQDAQKRIERGESPIRGFDPESGDFTEPEISREDLGKPPPLKIRLGASIVGMTLRRLYGTATKEDSAAIDEVLSQLRFEALEQGPPRPQPSAQQSVAESFYAVVNATVPVSDSDRARALEAIGDPGASEQAITQQVITNRAEDYIHEHGDLRDSVLPVNVERAVVARLNERTLDKNVASELTEYWYERRGGLSHDLAVQATWGLAGVPTSISDDSVFWTDAAAIGEPAPK